MEKQPASKILDFFEIPSKIAAKNLCTLINEAFSQIGVTDSLQKMQQWKTLSNKLNSKNKMICLGDKNHRKLIIEFIKQDSIQLYNNSYFNRAKIDAQFVNYLQQIGPFLFTQTLTIVNKLKLISNHFKDKLQCKRFSENHIDLKIVRILEMCYAKSRSINSNLQKFKSIVEIVDDREQLIKQLGKMLRSTWAHQKQKAKNYNVSVQPNQNFRQLNSNLSDISQENQDQGSQSTIKKAFRPQQ